MTSMRRFLLFVGITVLAVALLGAGDSRKYDFSLYQLDGPLFELDRTRHAKGAKLVVVDFFSVYCEPCKKALPQWKELYEQYHAKGLEMVLVAIKTGQDESGSAARESLDAYFKANPMPFPVVFDKYAKVAKQYNVANKGKVEVPKVFLLDKKGKLLVESSHHEDVMKTIKKRLQ